MRLATSFGKMFAVGKEIAVTKGPSALYSGFGFKALHMGMCLAQCCGC